MDEILSQYVGLMNSFAKLPSSEHREAMRTLIRTDLFFLMVYILRRRDMIHPWLLMRIREVQQQPDGYLDLWARDHRKSSIITFAKTIQDILASHGENPLPEWKGLQPTFGIFSHTRPIAKKFLNQIKTELESNTILKDLFPDVLYQRPDREAPRWSDDAGIVVRRSSNPKESTIEAWGLIDGQPVGVHFNVLIYDDIVTISSVTTPEMIKKTTEAWEFSLNLGDSQPRIRMQGTRWHFADTYRTILERQAAIPRVRPATHNGTLTGESVLLSQEQLAKKLRDMGPYSASSQLLLNPIADSKQTFSRDWFDRRFDPNSGWEKMNRVLLCDPSSGKKGNDFTAIAVVGRGEDGNTYLIDFLRDRLNLRDRVRQFIALHKKYCPQQCGYEQYGLQADIDYIKIEQERLQYHFDVQELGGKLSKADRINRLIPLCSDGKFWMPHEIYRTNSEGKLEELVTVLIEQEFLAWPVPVHDDGLDAISRIFDIEYFDFPVPKVEETDLKACRYSRYRQRRPGTWMSW